MAWVVDSCVLLDLLIRKVAVRQPEFKMEGQDYEKAVATAKAVV